MSDHNQRQHSPFYALHLGLGFTLLIVLIMGWNIYWENTKAAKLVKQQIVTLQQQPTPITDKEQQQIHKLQDNKTLYHLDLVVTIVAVLLCIALLMMTWYKILKTLYAWRNEVTTKQKLLTHINANLDDLVQQRTEKLRLAYQEKQQLTSALQQSQKLQAVGTLAAGVAHDFNNYLGVILAHSEFVESKLTEANQQQALEKIINTTHKASHLIEQLLTFARKSRQTKQASSLNEVITEVLNLVAVKIPENIKLQIELAEQLPQINIDPNQTTQALLNVILNALDAMPNGGKLRIKSRPYQLQQPTPELSETQYQRIDVQDTGKGIAPAVIDHIFEPFYTDKAVDKGTGLGLATAFGIMQQHGGTILVDSNTNGSCFSLLFPQ